ncbi:MAG: hypothetical protein CVV34_03905 [Methanomicrobiales archaeon HGW-Methanomicrobiales-5]|nr:MAG: hypothetical protein CVV34_03905 [Methanomicrobiales archaeon HGW-Methanomicrobiales-5]
MTPGTKHFFIRNDLCHQNGLKHYPGFPMMLIRIISIFLWIGKILRIIQYTSKKNWYTDMRNF